MRFNLSQERRLKLVPVIVRESQMARQRSSPNIQTGQGQRAKHELLDLVSLCWVLIFTSIFFGAHSSHIIFKRCAAFFFWAFFALTLVSDEIHHLLRVEKLSGVFC